MPKAQRSRFGLPKEVGHDLYPFSPLYVELHCSDLSTRKTHPQITSGTMLVPPVSCLNTRSYFAPFTAASAAWKPTLECWPSQKGLLTDAPHRHNAILSFPARS